MADNRFERRARILSVRMVRSFYFAFAGVAYLLRTQRSARIHVLVGMGVCALGVWLDITRVEWAVVTLTIASVLILEGLNTALEAAVDLASLRLHPLAKAAKDLAAGMVLIAALAAVVVGLLIFGPGVWEKVAR
ncbi:MAG: diacylglycerol kinase family protein [Tepidisphaeraceae bacterium]